MFQSSFVWFNNLSSLLISSSYYSLSHFILLPLHYGKSLFLEVWPSGHLYYPKSLSKCIFLGLISDLLKQTLEWVPGICISNVFLRWFLYITFILICFLYITFILICLFMFMSLFIWLYTDSNLRTTSLYARYVIDIIIYDHFKD